MKESRYQQLKAFLIVAVVALTVPLVTLSYSGASELDPAVDTEFDAPTFEPYETFTSAGEIPDDGVATLETDELQATILMVNSSSPNVVISPLDDAETFLEEMGHSAIVNAQ